MISYGKQFIDQTDIDTVVEVLKGNWLTQGPKVEEFEHVLKNKFGAKYCCAVANGTAALHLAALALGWKPGDIVITSPITFLATVNSIVYAGATPDFVDIDPVSYTIDANQVEEKIKVYQSKGKNVKAVIGVDYAGHPCDWEALRSIADRYKIQLVNDNSHALGACYKGAHNYATKYANAVIQSFHPVKHITTGEGGAILTNDSRIDEKIRLLRTHGMTSNSNIMDKHDGQWYYEMVDLGYNYRITDFQCALGISQLDKLGNFIDRRKKIAQNYNEAFINDDRFIVPFVNSNVNHAYHLYPLQVRFDKTSVSRIQLFDEMMKINIKLQVHYIPVHLQPYYRKKFGFNENNFPIAEKFYLNEISLPVFFELSEKEISSLIEGIDRILINKM